MASRSLEYAENLQNMMLELYRVCSHKAVVCIVAPYSNVSSNIVNPQYKQLFNEHSPRYWTHCSETLVDEDEFFLSENRAWSLLQEDAPAIDFRVLRMEFFYLPFFRQGYEPSELSLLRQSQMNVAYQIMFHLLVVKKPITTEEILLVRELGSLEEPDYVSQQRSVPDITEVGGPLYFADHLIPLKETLRKQQAPKKHQRLYSNNSGRQCNSRQRLVGMARRRRAKRR